VLLWLARTHSAFAQGKLRRTLPQTRSAPFGRADPDAAGQADFLKIVLTRVFADSDTRGVPLLEHREINHTGRNHVAAPYNVSTTAPLSSKFIQ
jgi:hypothetical protein